MQSLAKARILVTRFPLESRLGGEEVHTLTLMEGLRERGFEVSFLGSCTILLEEFTKRNFDVEKVCFAKPPVNLKWLLLFTLLSPGLFVWAGILLRRKRFDVLYCLSFGEKLLMTPWAILMKKKIVWLEHARIGKWLTRNPWRLLYSLLSRRVKIIVTSRAMKRFLPFAKNVEAISCGVSLEKAWALPKDVEDFLAGKTDGELKSHTHGSTNGFVIGMVARLTTDKGVDMMDRLVHSQPDTRLIVVGEGPYKFRTNPRVKILPNLRRGQLTTLYKSVDLFVLPSTEFDPFGMVAAEAMTAGAPTLVTEKCGIAFDLRNEREAFVIPATFKELDRTVKKVKKNHALLAAVAKRGEKFAKEEYALPRMIKEFEYLFSPVDG